MVLARFVETSAELGDDSEIGRQPILVPGGGRVKMARIGEAVGSDGAALGEPEVPAERLADVAARSRAMEKHGEGHAAGDDGDLTGRDLERTELGHQRDGA